ncbi:MAG: hypothetical protein QNJ03_05880 [Dinoroseobacter sp.]|nr:hypothetical protein [Dinoroseobacter sp.]
MDNVTMDQIFAALAKALMPHIREEMEAEITSQVQQAISDECIDDMVADLINMGTFDVSFRP